MPRDPIQKIEEIVRRVHDKNESYVKPVLSRYPLIFAFLIVFSVAAILHGFELVSDQIELFHTHPIYLILIGVIVLFLTGMLYKALEKGNE